MHKKTKMISLQLTILGAETKLNFGYSIQLLIYCVVYLAYVGNKTRVSRLLAISFYHLTRNISTLFVYQTKSGIYWFYSHQLSSNNTAFTEKKAAKLCVEVL